MGRRRLPLAHLVGTPGNDAIPPWTTAASLSDREGLPTPGKRSTQTPFNYVGKDQPKMGRVVVRFKEDERTRPLRKAIVSFALAVQDSIRAARRLWLPRTNMTTKFPHFREAAADPGRAVMLNSDMQRVLAAKRLGMDQVDLCSLPPRPKPRFLTRDPGVTSIILFNLAFLWWLTSRPL